MTTFEQMIERGHERVCFFHDKATGLRAIIAIHSTRLGNALGGTRRWHYATEADALYDVLRLSEGMTYKAAAANLTMGGAKSVILLPKRGHQSTEAEARAMGRFIDTFNGDYIAAEDVGVDPRFVDWMALETPHVMGGETVSTGGDPSPFTAHGVIHGMKACVTEAGLGSDFGGLTVAIQGVGNVGYHAARILHEAGASLIVADIDEQRVQRVVDEFGARAVSCQAIVTEACDVFCPCALGGVIDGKIVGKLQCRIVCGGANNVLDDPDEDAVALKNAGIIYGPDFVVNAGGLIHLAGLYLKMTPEQLDRKNAGIEQTTARILQDGASAASTHAAAVALAKERIRNGIVPCGDREQVHAG